MAKFIKNTKKGPVPHKVLSDRGVHLESSNRASENSNILHGRTAFMWADQGGKEIPVKVGQRCPKCKMRVRGINHESGAHHKGTVTRHRR